MLIRVKPQVGGLCPVFTQVPHGTLFVRWRGVRYCLTSTLTGEPTSWFSEVVTEEYCDHVPTMDVSDPKQTVKSRFEYLKLAMDLPEASEEEIKSITGFSQEEHNNLPSEIPADDFHMGFHKGRCKTPFQIKEAAPEWVGNITFWNGVADGYESRLVH